MEEFSPIARLRRIILEVKNAPLESVASRVWGEALGFNPKNEVEVYENSVEFYKLVQYVEDILDILIDDIDTKALNKKEFTVIKALSFTFLSSNQWRHHSSKITQSTLITLNMSRVVYNGAVSNKEVRAGDEYLQNLKVSVEELFESINHSDLPRELKLKLTGDVVSIKKAISRYELHGLDGIEAAISTVGGRIGLHSTELDKSAHKDIYDKLNSTLRSFVDVAKSANHGFALIENLSKLAKSIGIDIGE